MSAVTNVLSFNVRSAKCLERQMSGMPIVCSGKCPQCKYPQFQGPECQMSGATNVRKANFLSFKVRSAKCPDRQMSAVSNVRNVKCCECPMCAATNVRIVKCPECQISGVKNVRSAKHPERQMSGLSNVRSAKCPECQMFREQNVRGAKFSECQKSAVPNA